MGIEERVALDRDARRDLIVATTRALAEREGWNAVTTRRLASEIGYSQPILFKHFESMDDIVAAVALQGFEELARALGTARRDSRAPLESLRSVAHALRRFAVTHPAVYDAMFTRPSELPFGVATTPAPLQASFHELRDAVAAALGDEDVDTLTEVLWASLHGLTTLERNGRLPPDVGDARIHLLLDDFIAAHARR